MRSLDSTSTTSRKPSPAPPPPPALSSSDISRNPKVVTSGKAPTAAALRVKARITPSTTSTSTTTITNTTTATTTTTGPRRRRLQPTAPSTLQTPLRSRDHNVLNQAPTRPSYSFGKTRPTDKMPPPHHEKGASGTPRQPVLAPSAAKAMGRGPLTPKIASKPPQPAVTPLARRKTDASNTGSPAGHNNANDYIGNNITPRSGHRQSRVESTNTTPSGTPDPNRGGDYDGSRPGFFDGDPQARKLVTFSPPPQDAGRHDTPESKFFYASNARSIQAPKPQTAQPQQQQQQPKGPMFRYADGSAVDRSNSSNNNSRPTSPGVSTGAFTPMLAATQESHQASRFFHANGAAPDLQPAFRPTSSASGAGSTVSSAQKMAGPRVAPGGGARPVSPIKQPQSQSQAGLQQQQQPQILNNTRNNVSSPPQLGPPPGGRRRVSIEAGSPQPQPSPHSRSDSVTSGDAMIMSKFMASHTLSGGISETSTSPQPLPLQTQQLPTQPQQQQNPAMTMASIIQAAEDFEAQQSEESKNQSEVQSPTKSHAGDPLNELVANARRERKVQDLEIRNTSLEAINRSLERQLRKQTNELRRYRRLSRSGRLSLASAASSRIPSDSTVATTDTLDGLGGGAAIGALGLSDLDEEEDVEDDFEDDDSLYDTDPSEGDSVASPLGAGADRRRQRDEKRLQLDLSKHRELLVDSQKINQSIKRCLDWTEELINDGRKALDYHVRVSDVDLAPRVLAPNYEDEEDEDNGGVGDASRLESEVGKDSAEVEDTEAQGADRPKPSKDDAAGNEASSQQIHGLGFDTTAALPTISTPDETTPNTQTTSDAPMLKGANLAPPWGKDPQDRDSGVELPVDGG